MAPVKRKKQLMTTPPLKPVTSTTAPRLSPSKASAMTPSRLRSPIRKAHNGRLTGAQKQMMIDNLKLEMNERVRRLRAQYDVQAQALRHRIEMRINRVPKKLWTAKLGDLLLKQATEPENAVVVARSFAPANAKSFVEDMKRISDGHGNSAENTNSVPKKKVSKKNIASNSSRSANLPPNPSTGSQQVQSSSSEKPSRPPMSPIKRVISSTTPPVHKAVLQSKGPLQPVQPSTAEQSATEYPPGKVDAAKKTAKTSKSNALKTRTLKPTGNLPPPQAEEKHFIKDISSSGSLKENSFEGFGIDRALNGKLARSTAGGDANGRRVLRARK